MFKITNKGLYWGLIITFSLLYLFVGFVSTLHSITFFQLANTMSLAILLGITYELGQAAVLFSILLTKNKDKFLPWALMILLTGLQVTANVYASFRYMVNSGTQDWVNWQKSILIGVQATSPEMYQVIISWISGALLPIVALGMTALVANNLRYVNETEEFKTHKSDDTLKYTKKIEDEIPKSDLNSILHTPSKGEEALQMIMDEKNSPNKDNYINDNKDKEDTSSDPPYITNGINVLDPRN